jgi:hypothetical protein
MRSEDNSLGIRHVQVRLAKDEYDRLKTRADSDGQLLQAFVRQLILLAVNEDPEPGSLHSVPTKRRIYMEKLAKVLTSNDTEVINAVTQNIDVFFDRLRTEDATGKTGRQRTGS